MAVIRCSLQNGRLVVQEVLEFDPGDRIHLDASVEAQTAKFSSDKYGIIPCPPNADCGGGYGVILKQFPLGTIVTLPPDLPK
jgi:hypothetical protein